MVPFVLLALPAIVSRPILFDRVLFGLALTGFDRWPDSPPPLEIGNDVPLTTVRIVGAGRCRAFSGVTGGTDEAGNLARLVRAALD